MRRKYSKNLYTVIILVCFIFVGVWNKPCGVLSSSADENINLVLYYQDSIGYMVPVTREFKKRDDIARTALVALVDSTINRERLDYYGICPVLPVGTKVLGISINDSIATTDFNGMLLNYGDAVSETRIITSIVYTLTEFNSIKGVKLLIDGQRMERLKYDTDVSGVLDRKNVLINRMDGLTGFSSNTQLESQ